MFRLMVELLVRLVVVFGRPPVSNVIGLFWKERGLLHFFGAAGTGLPTANFVCIVCASKQAFMYT